MTLVHYPTGTTTKSPTMLQKEATNYKFNKNIPLRIYLKTCITLIEKAQSFFIGNDIENACLYYMRYLDLSMAKLPTHPEVLYNISSTCGHSNNNLELSQKEYQQILKLEVPAIIKIVEDLQKELDSRRKMENMKKYISAEPCLLRNNKNKTNKTTITSEDKCLNNTITKKVPKHTTSMADSRSKEQDKCNAKREVTLPATFNESLFNYSINYFKQHSTPSGGNIFNEESSNNHRKNKHNTNNNVKDTSYTECYYPSLTKISGSIVVNNGNNGIIDLNNKSNVNVTDNIITTNNNHGRYINSNKNGNNHVQSVFAYPELPKLSSSTM
ncbi:uncharacterized protein SCODWIG_02380 [Saccharomycodes ludwigii]|uniref:Regulator of free ubiquitin chains 1 n=1 Tax=Saccharomycodes ludwigii TaxID=36035 RepID=A0A376B7S2_9ASCO|nr:uncharacterized protein SCODWIG_02380 [Saccharomycodes ludwigii]